MKLNKLKLGFNSPNFYRKCTLGMLVDKKHNVSCTNLESLLKLNIYADP